MYLYIYGNPGTGFSPPVLMPGLRVSYRCPLSVRGGDVPLGGLQTVSQQGPGVCQSVLGGAALLHHEAFLDQGPHGGPGGVATAWVSLSV